MSRPEDPHAASAGLSSVTSIRMVVVLPAPLGLGQAQQGGHHSGNGLLVVG
jgi:hypothetical protein